MPDPDAIRSGRLQCDHFHAGRGVIRTAANRYAHRTFYGASIPPQNRTNLTPWQKLMAHWYYWTWTGRRWRMSRTQLSISAGSYPIASIKTLTDGLNTLRRPGSGDGRSP